MAMAKKKQKQQQKQKQITRDAIYALLQECSKTKDLPASRRVQSLMATSGLDSVSVLADHLIRLFATCGSLPLAQEAFHKVPNPTVYTWNSILAAHVKLGRPADALLLHTRMCAGGIAPDKVTLLCVLKGCGLVRDLPYGRLMHFLTVIGDPSVSTGVENMVVDMYAKCGHVVDAKKAFDGLLCKDVIAWGALMIGYAQEGNNHEVLDLLAKMHACNVEPNKVVFLASLRACGAIAAMKQGLLVHAAILDSNEILDIAMGSAIVDMYAKCGYLVEAQAWFKVLPEKDVKAWGAIVSGYSSLGNHAMVLRCYADMKRHGIEPDSAIFTSIFVSCSHAGLLRQGKENFHSMIVNHGLKPQTEHYNCMVDLLGRGGQLKEAKVILDTMTVQTNIAGWLSLLTSCRTYADPVMGRQCFDKIIEIEPTEARGYMLMSNIYADSNMWSDVEKIQRLRKRACAWRKPGRSCIEINNNVFEFSVGGKINPQSALIYEKLNMLNKSIIKEGYVPHLVVVVEPSIEFQPERC
jgi:pentatricopeptide repeat protein